MPAHFRLPGDRNSKGIEVDMTFNPTPYWRFFWNLGRTDTKLDDLSTEPTWDYLEQKLAVWRTYQRQLVDRAPISTTRRWSRPTIR